MTNSPVPVSPLKLPSSFNFAADVVDYWARRNPSQVALYWTNQSLSESKQLTYRHFSRQSHRISSLLASLGIRQGETCILISSRIPEWWEVATACLRSGVIMCPCTTLLVDKDIESRLQVSQAAAFIGDEASVAKCLKVRQRCPKLRKIVQIEGKVRAKDVIDFHASLARIAQDADFPVPGSLSPTSPALTFFTSGTTGPPKLVLHTQTSYPLAHALTGIHWLQLSPGEIYWNLSEQGWAKAAWSFFSSWNCGATLFIHDDRQPFSPKRTLEVLNKFPITTLCAPPTVYRQLVLDESRAFFESEKGRPKALRHCCGAGEPLNESVIRTWREMTGGIDIFDAYGQTETTVICANQKVNPVKPGSMGKPIPGVPLTIIDADGNVTDDGVEGDIAIAVSSDGKKQKKVEEDAFFGIFEGYIDRATGKIDNKIKSFASGKRFFITGDRASRDSEGYFWFVGRSDDVINSSGYRIGKFRLKSNTQHYHMILPNKEGLLTMRSSWNDRSLRSRIDSKTSPSRG
jgi:medium-chain acyl-CoA synthetase